MVNVISGATKILLSKVIKNDIKNFVNPMLEYTPGRAKTFSHVRLGSTENPNYSHEIVSFFDKNNNIIGKVSRETGKPDIYTEYGLWKYIDEYSESGFNYCTKYRKITRVAVTKNKAIPQSNIVKGGETGFKFDLMKAKYLPILPENNVFTRVLSEELQHVSRKTQRFNLSKECEDKLCINMFTGITRKYLNNPEIPTQIGIKTCDTTIKNKILNRDITSTNLFLNKIGGDVKIQSHEGDERTINDIINNPFAKYLYLRPEVKAKYLTRRFAKEKGLTPLNIKSYVRLNNGNSQACFSPYKGEVIYEKPYAIVPSTTAHEIAHAYQNSLAGQYEKINPTPYELRALKLFGECPETKKIEAGIYKDAIENYPKNLDEIENLREYPPYWNNPLEQGARIEEAGFRQYDNYPYRDVIEKTEF